ncbi:MAG: GlsB/YeaQ/YmgE family stress response membrane protein [Candidatus Izemoplasmatales bacterium]|nr:GlsB/YeaQ/YmgE family stress response membrane protein [bacterium]MDZ4197317.1 GlsB/YeaQ/YmgE family stress response membrane protein [Candidatus Izemoplasmatales bacterium]
MNILLWILFGGLVGWLASIVTRDTYRMSIFAYVLVGLLGSVLGGLIASFMSVTPIATFSWLSLGFSVLGAVLLLLALSTIRKPRNR